VGGIGQRWQKFMGITGAGRDGREVKIRKPPKNSETWVSKQSRKKKLRKKKGMRYTETRILLGEYA